VNVLQRKSPPKKEGEEANAPVETLAPEAHAFEMKAEPALESEGEQKSVDAAGKIQETPAA